MDVVAVVIGFYLLPFSFYWQALLEMQMTIYCWFFLLLYIIVAINEINSKFVARTHQTLVKFVA